MTSAVGTLAVREWSDGANTPLVFWHALGPCASGAELVELAPRLAAHGLAPFSVDGPGFGASPVAPVLLLLATQPPHVDQNREHLPRFHAAVPHADVRWVDGASHGVIADAGPPLGDEIAEWILPSVA